MASTNSRINKAAQHAPAAVVAPNTFKVYSDNSRTHEGGHAPIVSSLETLRRAVLGCLLWEDQFYESGVAIADRIGSLVGQVDPEDVYNLALEARNVAKLRHVPLLLAVEMLKHDEHKKLVRKLVSQIIQRPDEATEILSIYWKNELHPVKTSEQKFVSQRATKPIPMQLKRGIASALTKFDQYQMLKWQEKDKPVTMADVIRLVHPDPRLATRQSYNVEASMADVYKGIMLKTAGAPDTWESRLSAAGKSAKKDIFTDMLGANKLASLALISNLRGMIEAGVDIDLIRSSLNTMNIERVLPYKFITAARYAPLLKTELQAAMFRCVAGIEKLPGKTVLLVDISSSMNAAMSRRRDGRPSDLRRVDGAAALCVLAQSICEDTAIYLFNTGTYQVNKGSIVTVQQESQRGWGSYGNINKKFTNELIGFDLSDAISNSVSGGTDLKQAVEYINKNETCTRLVVFTDDESSTTPPAPKSLGYGINVASGDRGVTYDKWVHINGFSEGTLVYVSEFEKQLKRLSDN